MYVSHRFSILMCTVLVAAGVACHAGSEKRELPPGASAEDERWRPLLDHELPVSLRTKDQAPSDARVVQATDEELRLDGEPVIALVKGRVPAAEQTGGIIPKLKPRLQLPARGTVALRLQANLPYETIALILNTAHEIGMSNAAFQVRPNGETQKIGWLGVEGFVMSSKADDLPPITAVKHQSWNAFTDKWQSIFDGCRTAASGDCAYVNDNFAVGGTLKMELMASGRGVNIDFFRRGLTPAQEAKEDKKRERQLVQKKAEFLKGRISHDEMIEILLLGDPSTYALFQFRYQEAFKPHSALAKTMGPMCHTERCGIVLTADTITPLVNVVGMLGAAFPDGTPSPAIAFEMPWTERPKPAILSEWIAQQSAKSGR
jgi:hypothetical protein